MKVWTQDYQPFRLGGDLHAPMSAKVHALGPFDLGQNYWGYLIAAPWGETFVAEEDTGAIVGFTIKQVQEDIKAGDPGIMKAQVEAAQRLKMKAIQCSTEDFWCKMAERKK